ncbi:MAG: hypothetical protein ACKVS9_00095 [Phycisphaerae bacterium]
MADAVEVLQYKVDLADVETKARRMLELTQQIRTAGETGQGTADLEGELAKLQGGFAGASRGAGAARDGAIDFDRKAEKLSKTLLGAVNPALAQSADLLFDVIEGVPKMSAGLLAVAGAAAGVAAIANAIRSMVEEAKAANREIAELSNAMAKLRDKGVNDQDAASRAALKAGVAGGGGAIMEDRARLGERGVPADFAQSATLARLLSGPDFNEQEFLQGMVASGEPLQFSGKPNEDRATIKRIQRVGGKPEAARAFDQFIRDVGPKARRDAPERESVYQTERQVDIDEAVAEVEKRGGFTAEQLGRARELLSDPSKMADMEARFDAAGDKSPLHGHINKVLSPLTAWATRMIGAEVNIAELAGTQFPEDDLATLQAARLAEKFMPGTPGVPGSTAPAAGVTTINITNNRFATAHFGGGNALRNPNFDSPVHSPGGGLHRNGVE